MNTKINIETSIKNKSADSSLKSEKWVDVWTEHTWLAKKFPNLIDAMTIVEAETSKAVLLRNPLWNAKKVNPLDLLICKQRDIHKAWVAKSLIQMRGI
ncbi:MAG: hypothetical protein LBD63_02775 [Mycoplasmataceae bacterium]|jgi:hypothetical protein|nr:hypothetical protein [Mycoplasmataceae bacterium]